MKALFPLLVLVLSICPGIIAHGDEAVAAILPRRSVQVVVPVTPACPGAACPTVAPAVDPSAGSPTPKAIPPAAVASIVIPTLTIAPPKAPTTPKPFPGPSVNAPRILWVWDNGVIFELGAEVWRWQNDDGTWNQK